MRTLLPGATIGFLGGGQLAKMMAVEAARLGYRTAVLDPGAECPARGVTHAFVQAAWSDPEGARALAEQVDVLTLDTEHIPADVLDEIEKIAPVRPAPSVLRTVQDRLSQKTFLEEHGFPAPAFRGVATEDELEDAVAAVGTPAVLKSRRGGYDGKGQARLKAPEDAASAWESIDRAPAILEEFVPFEREISVVLARSATGDVVTYPVVENAHRDGILHLSRAPARVAADVAEDAVRIATGVAHALEHVGTMAVEMFVLPEDHPREDGGRRDGSGGSVSLDRGARSRVLVNEIAPRVHNSGHLTAAAPVNQFEQHVRAILGLPLGTTELPRPAAMVNLLGDLWADGEPDWRVVLEEPHAQLHLYGKTDARPGRKMGHVVTAHEDADEAVRVAERVYAALRR